MAVYFLFVTTVLSAVVFGLEFLGSIFAGFRHGFGFPSFYLAVTCACGLISQAIIASAMSGLIMDFTSYPGYLQAVTFFGYVQFLMLLFLPVLTVFLLIRQHKQNDNGSKETPKSMTILVYFGFFYAVVALILLFTSMGLASRFNTNIIMSSSDIIVYVRESIATYMILWFFIVFWIVAACLHQSIQLQHISSFIGYGILITIPMIITTITFFVPGATPLFDAGQYAFFFLWNVPIFAAVPLALVCAHRWIALPEPHHSPSA